MTSIEWTDKTWNPTRGCSRVSKGCEHCYAEGVARRFAGKGQPYEGLVRRDAKRKPKAQWNGVVRLVPKKLAEPLSWRSPQKVFVNSMSDLFHEELSLEDIAAVFGVMAACPQHTFQVLTKRPRSALEFFRWYEGESGAGGSAYAGVCEARHRGVPIDFASFSEDWPLSNVWLGVSIEDQATADERIPVLLTLPAAVRFVSYEPALGPVDWSCVGATAIKRDALRVSDPWPPAEQHLDWVIIGGESGHGARPFDIAWARSTIAQCREAGVACFVKQLGGAARDASRGYFPNTELRLADRKGGDMSEWPEDLRVREFPHA